MAMISTVPSKSEPIIRGTPSGSWDRRIALQTSDTVAESFRLSVHSVTQAALRINEVLDIALRGAPAQPWLDEALTELADADEEAREEGYRAPGQVAKEHAERMLRQLSQTLVVGQAPSVYPTEDGDIAIVFGNPASRSILHILCEKEGSAAVYSSIGGKSGRVRYHNAAQLPDRSLFVELDSLLSA